MRTASTVSKICMWVFFCLSLLFHTLALIGLAMNNQSAIEQEKTAVVYDLVPMLIGVGVMLVSVVLFTVLPKGRLIPLIAAAAAGVLLIFVTIDLGNTFPPSIGADGSDVGLTAWRLVYRHYSMVLTPLCMAVAYFTGRAADKAEQARFNASYRSQYHFDGAPLFRDEDSGEKRKRASPCASARWRSRRGGISSARSAKKPPPRSRCPRPRKTRRIPNKRRRAGNTTLGQQGQNRPLLSGQMPDSRRKTRRSTLLFISERWFIS